MVIEATNSRRRAPRSRTRPPIVDNPPALDLEQHVFYLFSSILARRNRTLNAVLAQHRIDFPRWRVLAVLSRHPGCSMQQLAEHTSVDRTTLAHTVGLMVDEGLVDREARASDRRSVALSLSPRGWQVLRQILPAVIAQNDSALAGLSGAETSQLLSLLRRVLANLVV